MGTMTVYKMPYNFLFLILFSLLAYAPHAVDAAEFYVLPSVTSDGRVSQIFLHINGTIETGDANLIIKSTQAFIPSGFESNGINILAFVNSEGGSVEDTIALGEYFRSLKVMTIVRPNDKCYSSCIFIFVSGVNRTAYQSSLGIHRPYIGQASEDMDFEKAYRKTYDTVMSYLKKMHIPSSLGDLMFSIPPDELRLLSIDEVNRLIGDKDPVFDEEKVAAQAKRFGISSAEYRKRKALVDKLCSSLITVQQNLELTAEQVQAYMGCRKGIMEGNGL